MLNRINGYFQIFIKILFKYNLDFFVEVFRWCFRCVLMLFGCDLLVC